MAKKKVMKIKEGAYETGEIVKVDGLELKTGERRGSCYDGIYAKLEKLKPGDAFIVPIPKGVESRVFHNRTNAAIRRGPVKAPAGCMFRKRTTVDGKVAICCVKVGESNKQLNAKAKGGAKAPAKTVKPKVKAKAATKRRSVYSAPAPVAAAAEAVPA